MRDGTGDVVGFIGRYDGTRVNLPVVFGLSATIGLQTILLLAAIQRIPLGTSVAVEFLGPMTVAALLSHRMRALIWPALALLGFVLLTEP
ncbi:MAG: hypothetical protein ACYCWN_01315 [Ferrimicrobium sp.]